jgi:hypothetical protein
MPSFNSDRNEFHKRKKMLLFFFGFLKDIVSFVFSSSSFCWPLFNIDIDNKEKEKQLLIIIIRFSFSFCSLFFVIFRACKYKKKEDRQSYIRICLLLNLDFCNKKPTTTITGNPMGITSFYFSYIYFRFEMRLFQ